MILPSYNTTRRLIKNKILVKVLTQQDYIKYIQYILNEVNKTKEL